MHKIQHDKEDNNRRYRKTLENESDLILYHLDCIKISNIFIMGFFLKVIEEWKINIICLRHLWEQTLSKKSAETIDNKRQKKMFS